MITHRNARQNRLNFIIIEFVVLLLALLVRLAYFNELSHIIPGFLEKEPFCDLDGIAYHEIYALGLLKGIWPGDRPFFHMILYPFYLAAIYTLVGVSLKVVVFSQILFEVLACAALYGIGRLIFNRPTGLLASFFLSFYDPLIFFNACYAQEVLSIPLFTLTIFFLLKAHQTEKLSYLVIAGLMAGLALLSRPTFLLLVPIALAWWFFERLNWRKLVLRLVIYGAVIFFVTLPATLHNYRTDHHFSPTPISGWEIFFLGNNPVAEGMGTVDWVLYTQIDLPGESYIISIINQAKAAKRASDVYRAEALRFIRTDPLAWLNLLGRKTYLLLGESDSNIISPYFLHNLQTVWFLGYFPFEWRSLFIMAILGLLLLKHRHQSLLLLLIITLPLFTVLFHIQYRFRLLLVPLVVMYAAALITAAPRLGRLRFRLALIILAVTSLFLPALGWLLALFILSSLWSLIQRRNWPSLKWAALAAWSYLVVGFLLSQVIIFITQTQQQQTIFLGPQIAGPIAIGQSFIVHCNGFNRLRLVVGAFGLEQQGTAAFHLRPGLESDEDIYTATVDIAGLKDRDRQDFTFPAQAHSAGQPYFFFVESPSTALAEAITLRGAYNQPFDRYREGGAYAGQPGRWQALAGDLAFTARCETGLFDLAQQTFQSFPGSPLIYWGLFAAHLALLIVALLRLAQN